MAEHQLPKLNTGVRFPSSAPGESPARGGYLAVTRSATASVTQNPAGSITGADFLAMRVFDVTVHTWDLARATGSDERIDDGLASAALEAITRLDTGPGFGIVATGTRLDSDPALDQLLDLSGRRP